MKLVSRLTQFFRPAHRATGRPAARPTPRAASARPSAPASARPPIARPLPWDAFPAVPVAERTLGQNLSVGQVWSQVSALPAPHVTAALGALHTGGDALRHLPSGARAEAWGRTHLIHSTFAPGTMPSVWTAGAASAHGAQLGAAQYVRGRQGHLHVYTAVLVGGGVS